MDECKRVTEAPPIGTRWLDTNKGDENNPNYRSRWVAQEYRRAWVESIFAATPNIEAVRLLLADAASRCRTIGPLRQNICLMIVDIKRAFFYAPSQKPIYVRLPPEDPRAGDPNLCGRLNQSLYGTRDAGYNWHCAYSKFLRSLGFEQGVANPCHFIDRKSTLKCVVHGDDFLISGSLTALEDLKKKFANQWDCKTEIIGNEKGLKKSARFLNRVITYNDAGIDFEGDQRLIEALVDDLKLQGGNTSPIPGTKAKAVPKAEHQKIMERRMGADGGRRLHH